MSAQLDRAADEAIVTAPIRKLRAGLINIDAEIQRALDGPRVNRMAEDFDPNALGVITVSEREDGFFVVDGQHRVAAAIRANGEDHSMEARVFTGLTRAEEAILFRRLNTTKKPQAFDLFRSRLVEGDPSARAIFEIITRHGWKLGFSGPTGGRLSAVAAMERIYALEPLALDRSIYTITQAWGHTREASDGRLIEGVGLFYWRHGNSAEIDEVIQKLATHSGGASAVIGRANSIRELTQKSVGRSLATYLTDLYNKNKRTRALPPFEAK